MEVGGWVVQVSPGFLGGGKSSQNSSKPVLKFWSSTPCVFFLRHDMAEDSTRQANLATACRGLRPTTGHHGCLLMMMNDDYVCIYSTLLKVVSYYDLSVLSMPVMGFQKKKVWQRVWWVEWALSKLDFWNFLTLQSPFGRARTNYTIFAARTLMEKHREMQRKSLLT